MCNGPKVVGIHQQHQPQQQQHQHQQQQQHQQQLQQQHQLHLQQQHQQQLQQQQPQLQQQQPQLQQHQQQHRLQEKENYPPDHQPVLRANSYSGAGVHDIIPPPQDFGGEVAQGTNTIQLNCRNLTYM